MFLSLRHTSIYIILRYAAPIQWKVVTSCRSYFSHYFYLFLFLPVYSLPAFSTLFPSLSLLCCLLPMYMCVYLYIHISIWGAFLRLNYPRHRNCCRVVVIDAVPEHGQRLHEDLQLDLYDAAHRTLVGMSSVPGAHVARISAQLVGRHQRITGGSLILMY